MKRVILSAIVAILLCTPAFAADVSGVWRGKVYGLCEETSLEPITISMMQYSRLVLSEIEVCGVTLYSSGGIYPASKWTGAEHFKSWGSGFYPGEAVRIFLQVFEDIAIGSIWVKPYSSETATQLGSVKVQRVAD